MAKVDVNQWRFLGSQENLPGGQRVTLRNEVEDKSIRFGERESGINLVWDDAADLANISMHRRDEAGGPVAYGEHLAIRVDGGGFIHYREREHGINLVWSETPVHQWEITGGTFGRPVALTRRVGLFNRFHGDHMVYGERPSGINLRWWADLDNYGDYPPLPRPPELRGQSGESGQIVLTGTASEIEVLHGGTDDVLDWHIYIRLDPAVRRRLLDHLLDHGKGAKTAHVEPFTPPRPLTEQDLERIYCEFMVLDGYDNSTFDEKFFSADLKKALMLDRTAWDVSAEAAAEQNLRGATVDVTGESRLCRRAARVSLQGAFVNDRKHGFRAEIHPLDSLAYAIDAQASPLSVGPDDPGWPATVLTWRVAAFTNSTFHRINGADYLKKERTTTWYLPLPKDAPGNPVKVAVNFPGFINQARGRAGLDKLRPTSADRYQDFDLISESHAIEQDFRTGERRFRVTVTMAQADLWGGMFLADYTLRVGQQVIQG
jgi:hypothetical protein